MFILAFEKGTNKQTGELQWEASQRKGSVYFLYIADKESIMPLEDGEVWLCKEIKEIFCSLPGTFKIVSVDLIKKIMPNMIELRFTRDKKNKNVQWCSKDNLYSPSSGREIPVYFFIDRESMYKASSQERQWECRPKKVVRADSTVIHVSVLLLKKSKQSFSHKEAAQTQTPVPLENIGETSSQNHRGRGCDTPQYKRQRKDHAE